MIKLFSDNRKIRATQISVGTATSLAALKVVTALFTGSMSILASAIDSLLDIGMSLVNYFAVRHAEKPADDDHPYGHGKFETLATLFQAVIITVSGLFVLYESGRRLLGDVELVQLEGGMWVLAISAAASYAITRHLRRVARETDSSALEADSLHYSMDVYTNLALLLGLALIRWTGAAWIDPLLSFFVGLYIIHEAYDLVKHSMRDVLDAELPATVRKEVESLINAHKHRLIDFHNLRTRRAGSQKIMDFHITVCKEMTVQEAHEITDHLEERIKQEISNADVIIHVEPCERVDCPGRSHCEAAKARPGQAWEDLMDQNLGPAPDTDRDTGK